MENNPFMKAKASSSSSSTRPKTMLDKIVGDKAI